MEKCDVIFGQTGGQHPLAGWIDHTETYGPHVIESMVSKLPALSSVVDLGAGSGRDLAIVSKLHPSVRTIAVEAGAEYANSLREKFDEVLVADIEKNELPLEPGSCELIMANQVLEHTKEIFWIFHQVTRSLKVGGHFLFGVPNIASLHNRFLMLFGIHPTQHKLCSAHVRPFSKNDTLKFLNACFPKGYELVDFQGAQFYPFPKPIARALSSFFPSAAFSIFFLIRKTREYDDEFIAYPAKASLETNFWTGGKTSGQYEVLS